jgi:hypothetical protein
VDQEDRPVVIHHENDLQQTAPTSRAPDQQFIFSDPPRVRASGLSDNLLGLLGMNSVLERMLDVPLIPAELHWASSHLSY